jgi:hypothetical protein
MDDKKRKDQHDSDPRESKSQGRDDDLQLISLTEQSLVFTKSSIEANSDNKDYALRSENSRSFTELSSESNKTLELWMYQQSL